MIALNTVQVNSCVALKVADFGLARFGLVSNVAYRLVERGLLMFMKLFDGAVKGRRNEDLHQPNL